MNKQTFGKVRDKLPEKASPNPSDGGAQFKKVWLDNRTYVEVPSDADEAAIKAKYKFVLSKQRKQQ